MKHYICKGGCRGVSNVPGVCMALNCDSHLHKLEECNCTDGKHFGAFDEKKPDGKHEENKKTA